MECFDCHTPFTRSTKFCSNCGKDLRPRRHAGAEPSPRQQRVHEPAARARLEWPNPEAMAMRAGYEKAWAEHNRRRSVRMRWAVVVALCAAAYVGVRYGVFGGVMVGTLGSVMLAQMASGYVAGGMHAQQYFALPYSQAESGKPRCVWCGHVGVYTRGAYATSTKYYDCSKFGKTMYYS